MGKGEGRESGKGLKSDENLESKWMKLLNNNKDTSQRKSKENKHSKYSFSRKNP